jgi:hypothetical protein
LTINSINRIIHFIQTQAGSKSKGIFMKYFHVIIAYALVAISINATTIHVPGDQPTIQDGINAASNSDTVLVAPGTYSGPGNSSLHTYGKAIVVKGDMYGTVIQATSGSDTYAFYLNEGEDSTTVITGFTINGFTDGIYLEGGYVGAVSPKLDSLNIVQCSNYGIYCAWGPSNPIITNCLIVGNDNGIWVRESEADAMTVIDNCLFDSNGIAIRSYGKLVVSNTLFKNNEYGVNTYEFLTQTVEIRDCVFWNNSTAAWGAVELHNCQVTYGVIGVSGPRETAANDYLVDSCEFSGITGYVFKGVQNVTISNSIIQNNPGKVFDGEVTLTDTRGDWSIINCQITDNGDGIYIGKGTGFRMIDCIYTGNGSGVRYFSDWCSGSVEIIGCTFSGIVDTVVLVNGDAVNCGMLKSRNILSAPVYISECLFVNNPGNALVLGGHPVFSFNYRVENCTFVNNASNAITLRRVDSVVTLNNNVINSNSGAGIVFTDTSVGTRDISCNDVYENSGGNYVGIPDQTGVNGNISLDPRFCDPASGDFSLAANSPCAPENNTCSTLIGALPVGCDTIARTWYVDTAGNDSTGDGSLGNPFATIQRGIDAAVDADTVLVAPGMYSGPGNDNLHTDGKAILVTGNMDSTIIQYTTGSAPHAFDLRNSSEDSNTVIKGFTIRGFTNGIYMTGASPELDSLRIEQCSNYGIYAGEYGTVSDVAPIIRNSMIFNNTNGIWVRAVGPDTTYIMNCWIYNNADAGVKIDVTGPGGVRPQLVITNCIIRGNNTYGIYYENYFHGVPVIVDSCLFDSNTTSLSGAFRLQNSTVRDGVNGIEGSGTAWIDTVIIDNCMFENLTGYVLKGAARMTISNSTIQNNSGQIYTASTLTDVSRELNLMNCTIINNGGGIEMEMESGLSMSGCIYSGNFGGIDLTEGVRRGVEINQSAFFGNLVDTLITASFSGSWSASPVQVTECIFEGNTGHVLVLGGIIIDSYKYTVQNCTFANNIGSAITVGYFDSTVSITNNVISFNAGSGIAFTDSAIGTKVIACNDVYSNTSGNYVGIPDQTGLNGNISEDPLFCDTANENYSIQDNSPCDSLNNSCGVLMGAYGVSCSCCVGLRGNIDSDSLDLINIADVTYLIDYLFQGGPAPICPKEADVSADDMINIVDLTWLIEFLFQGGQPPEPCS